MASAPKVRETMMSDNVCFGKYNVNIDALLFALEQFPLPRGNTNMCKHERRLLYSIFNLIERARSRNPIRNVDKNYICTRLKRNVSNAVKIISQEQNLTFFKQDLLRAEIDVYSRLCDYLRDNL